jgi:hypothetical protein
MKSKEEILASKLYDLLSDYRIESYLIGRYFAQMAVTEVYDKFEEMVVSARQEKQNRIEWLKDIIIGETKVETTFENKVFILKDMLMHWNNDPSWGDYWGTSWNTTLYLAHLIYHNYAVATDMGVDDITDCFDALLLELGIENDTGFSSLEQILEDFEPVSAL